MKSISVIRRSNAEEARILERQLRRQADEPFGQGALRQPTDVEVYIDRSEDIEALERGEWEIQQQAALS